MAQWGRCVGALARLNRSKPIGVGAGSDARRVDNARDRGLVKARRPRWAGRRNGERGRGVAARIRLPRVGAGSAFVASATPVIAVLSKRCARVGRAGGMEKERGGVATRVRWLRVGAARRHATGQRARVARACGQQKESKKRRRLCRSAFPSSKMVNNPRKALKAPLQRRDGAAPSFRDVTVESDMRALIQWRFL